jgi:hypothetical protein
VHPPLAHRHPGIQLVAAVCPDHEERQLGKSASQPGQDLEAQVIGIAQVLEGDHRRCGGDRRQEIDDVEDEEPATSMRVDEPTRFQGEDPLEERVSQVLEWGGPGHRPRKVEEGRRGNLEVASEGLAPDRAAAARRCPPLDRAQEPCLASPRLAREQEEMAGPVPRGRETSSRQFAQVIPSDEDRTDVGPDAIDRRRRHAVAPSPGTAALVASPRTTGACRVRSTTSWNTSGRP